MTNHIPTTERESLDLQTQGLIQAHSASINEFADEYLDPAIQPHAMGSTPESIRLKFPLITEDKDAEVSKEELLAGRKRAEDDLYALYRMYGKKGLPSNVKESKDSTLIEWEGRIEGREPFVVAELHRHNLGSNPRDIGVNVNVTAGSLPTKDLSQPEAARTESDPVTKSRLRRLGDFTARALADAAFAIRPPKTPRW